MIGERIPVYLLDGRQFRRQMYRLRNIINAQLDSPLYWSLNWRLREWMYFQLRTDLQ